MNSRTGSTERGAASQGKHWIPAAVACLSGCLLLAGIVLGLFHRGHRQGAAAGTESSARGSGSAQDELSISSATRDTSTAAEQAPAGGASLSQGAGAASKQKELLARQQAAQQAAAEQAAREAAIAEKSRELEAKENQLEQDRLRVEADRQRAAREAESARVEAAQRLPKAVAYNGPSSGTIVWQGEVRGATLVTINGNVSNTGQVVSGGLPGVLVMVQPGDAKHVGVAGTPAPSNSFRRLTLRIQGNGVVQEVIRWAIP